MTVLDLFAVMAIVCGVCLLVMIGHAVWAALYGDLHWFDDQPGEEDEHAQGLSAPWNRKRH